MSTTKIGWIGLGRMGIPMSQRLLKAGYEVTVFNRSKEKEALLKAMGAAVASSPSELLSQSDVVIVMVSDDTATKEIFNGDNGLLSTESTRKILINMSTISPDLSQELALLCSEQGNNYLDAPVSGSVKQAEDGLLVIMAGGDETAFETAKPVFEHIGKLAMLVGSSGAGNAAKLAINTLLAFYAQGLSEAVVFARNNQIKTDDLITLINNSAIGNVFTRIKGDAIINNNYQPVFALKHIAKDLRLAKDKGLDSPLANTVYQSFQQAEGELGEEDIISIIKSVEPS